MTAFGYALSSEEHGPRELVENARRAEEAGFEFAMVSDHFHPWTDAQGQSPFVWSVIGGIAQATERLRLGTGVTCPTIRIHPAIIAHAAATSAVMMDGRFFLGLGTGENLNEHVVGEGWPAPDERLAMLEEAIEIMRLLWAGGEQTFRGSFYDVEQARLYTLPEDPVEIAVAAAKPGAAQLAGRAADAFINTAPDAEVIGEFEAAGGQGKPKYGQITVCWAESEEEATRTVHRLWANEGLPGELAQLLPTPTNFEEASQLVTPEMMAESVPCGPDTDKIVAAFQEFADAGFDELYVQQIGDRQAEWIELLSREIVPRFG
jgi:G6PDH family F420-dependent oxidoreductase